MNFLEEKYGRQEKTYRWSYYINDTLFAQLEELSMIYRTKISELINDSVEILVQSKNIEVYKRAKNELSIKYTVLMRESALDGLEDLSGRYGISLSKLINIAISTLLKSNH